MELTITSMQKKKWKRKTNDDDIRSAQCIATPSEFETDLDVGTISASYITISLKYVLITTHV